MRLPIRIELGVLAFLGFINLYMTRVNLSVISVAMVKRNVTIRNEETSEASRCIRGM